MPLSRLRLPRLFLSIILPMVFDFRRRHYAAYATRLFRHYRRHLAFRHLPLLDAAIFDEATHEYVTTRQQRE